jgi:signal transduction histidine kinase
MKNSAPTLNDLIGIEYAKLGFFREVQEKIAELHASNLELTRKQHHIEAILNGITDVMVVLTPDLQIESVNQVFHAVHPDTSPHGRYCYEVFRDSDRMCSSCPVVTARDANQVCRQHMIYSIAGKNRHFEVTASPLRNPQGAPCRILVLRRDITMEKEYQAKFYQAEKMATIGVLAAGVAHEINNPLTGISGFAEGLRRRLPRLKEQVDKDLADDFNEYIGIILRECKRCQDIVQNLLTFGRQSLSSFSSVDLNSLVIDILKLLQNHLKQYRKNIISLKLDKSLPAIAGDASHLKQVILNLLSNALDATREKGTIAIRTFVEDDGWVGLTVEDGGCGIPAENLDKLFEPFFTTKPVGQGVGIGLSTCYNIVQKHGGEIIVSSRDGEGATFHVRLPKLRDHGAI